MNERHYGDDAFRPDTCGILIPGKRGKLLSVLYKAGGEGLHPVVLMLHGIPGCEQNADLAQALRRAGFHVLLFHYSGSWGSDGDYSLSHNVEDANTVLDYILKDETQGFDKSKIFALGHSMGGFVCGQLTARRKEIKAGVLLMPCDMGRLPIIAQEDEGAYQTVCDVFADSAHWLQGTSGEALRQEVWDHSREFAFQNLAPFLKEKPILCIGGTLDIYTPPRYHCDPLEQAILEAGGIAFQKIEYPTDHCFADYRLTVAEAVTSFLENQIKG